MTRRDSAFATVVQWAEGEEQVEWEKPLRLYFALSRVNRFWHSRLRDITKAEITAVCNILRSKGSFEPALLYEILTDSEPEPWCRLGIRSIIRRGEGRYERIASRSDLLLPTIFISAIHIRTSAMACVRLVFGDIDPRYNFKHWICGEQCLDFQPPRGGVIEHVWLSTKADECHVELDMEYFSDLMRFNASTRKSRVNWEIHYKNLLRS